MKLGKYELESPLFNGGGVVKSIDDVRAMSQTGVGAVIAGSFTLEPRLGNSANGEVVYFHDIVTGITYNSLGMPNMGIKGVAKDLREMIRIAHDFGKPLIMNLAPVSDDPATEMINTLKAISSTGIEELDGVELNAGCPNVVTANGGRHELLSHHPERLMGVLGVIRDISSNQLGLGTLIVRISPFRNLQDAHKLMSALRETPVNAVSAFNTFPGGKLLNAFGEPVLQVPGGMGGKSGRGMNAEAEQQTRSLMEARNTTGLEFDIIGSNGIYDCHSMKRRMDLGVAAVGATTIFYESSSWKVTVDNMLTEYAELIESQ